MLLVRLARLCCRHRWAVLAVWLVVVLVGAAAAPSLFGRLTAEVGAVDASESVQAGRDLWRAAPGGEELYALVARLAVVLLDLLAALTLLPALAATGSGRPRRGPASAGCSCGCRGRPGAVRSWSSW